MTTYESSTQAQLVVTAFISLDGVIQAPGGPDEDRRDGFAHGGWVLPLFDAALGQAIDETYGKVTAFLLGRRTYDIFASHWPHVTDPSDSVARKLNSLPKYVASRTTDAFTWEGTRHIKDVVPEVAALKRELRGELQVHGSFDLVQTLLAHDLIDEFRLMTFPVILGSGRRLFNHNFQASALALVDSRVSSTGVIISNYRLGGKVARGNVVLEDNGSYRMESIQS